ncbi:MAG: SirB1 family protein [Kiloniellales bacterium]
MSNRSAARATLRRIGAQPDAAIDLAEAALALASLDRPRVDLGRYRHHLALLVRDVGDAAGRRGGGGDAADHLPEHRLVALNRVILGKYGYTGDKLTYDDLQNANLMRVIDRRKGLPVVLGILYLHAARGQGWEAFGLNFPGHFLIRLDARGRRVIVDPFNDGRSCDTVALRGLLKATVGDEVELDPALYAPVANRAILVRLQNNIKLRLIGAQRMQAALEVVENMLLLAPGQAELWHEAAVLNAGLDNLGRAIECLETCLERPAGDAARHAAASLLQRLRKQLN